MTISEHFYTQKTTENNWSKLVKSGQISTQEHVHQKCTLPVGIRGLAGPYPAAVTGTGNVAASHQSYQQDSGVAFTNDVGPQAGRRVNPAAMAEWPRLLPHAERFKHDEG